MMKRLLQRVALAVVLCVLGTFTAKAIGWPANYQGVMLQGFYWDSYTDTKWTNLESQADELSKYFSLIWVPNSGKASGQPNMGYMPIYWFTNHNSSFGSETQLRSMIKAFKAKGTGIIADVVINHRVGVNDWGDFPTETWNGKTYSMGASDVCSTDEWRNNGGNPTGATDTGDDFGAARDLDHTGANVQNCCKDYCKFLLTDLGYAGFRYDMVKGYGGQYTKMYNQASNAEFSVGEYWDGSYDAVKAWIDATGKTSAAFDFPFKYAVNDAFSSNDMTKLVWKANGTTNQPAGVIHFGYSQYAVTFIDNHDTYRDNNKFNGNVLAANAFMLMSPGTPCVFLPHYKSNKTAIQRMIDIRNSVGLHNNSAVTVLQSSNNCYLAEVTGANGKLIVKIGSAQVSPTGYTNSDIVASGNDYCIWTKVPISGGGGGDDIVVTPEKLYVMGNLKAGSWSTNVGVAMTKTGNKFTAKGVELVAAPVAAGEAPTTNAYFTFTTALGTTGADTEWDEVINASDRYGAIAKDVPITAGSAVAMKQFVVGIDCSSAYSWKTTAGTYDITADFETMTVTIVKSGSGPDPDPDPDPVVTPENLYVMGNISGGHWDTSNAVAMTKDGHLMVAKVTIEPSSATSDNGYFSLVTKVAASEDNWPEVNSGDRYGAATKDEALSEDTPAKLVLFPVNVSASSANSWKVPAGTYYIGANFKDNTILISKNKITGVDEILDDAEDATPVYYNLQGVCVENPSAGLYIKVCGKKVTKVYIH